MNRNSSEKRQHKRIAARDRLFVQVVSCNEQPELVGTTLSCKTMDVSAGGIRIDSSDRIPVGTKLDLWVDVQSRPGKFFLSSDVRWVQESRGILPSYHLGVELQDGAATDIAEWRRIHQ